ncbi:MAG TPA: glycosyltransferase [Polyangia bacterium]|nr:glycosyltransferase [Polyangia bacterium]
MNSSGVEAVVAILVVLLVYTYVGYPLAIGLLARLRRRRPADPGGPLPSVSVCLPVYNGAGYLRAKVASLLAQDYPGPLEILIYCDGCSDDTEAVARALAAEPAAAGRIRVFASAQRSGKPTGLNTLAPAATGELLLLNDVRQPLSPNAIRSLATALQDPTVGCATGNLVLVGSAGSGVYWRYENWIRRQESAFRGVVGMTGPIGMVRRADLGPLPADLILDDVWVPIRLALGGRRTVLVPEAQAQDAAFADQREFQRKVRTLAGNYQIFARLPRLLLPIANPIWFETFSHKILRLVAPWLLVALLLVSLRGARAAGWIALLLAGQLAFYGLAALGPRLGRVASLPRTFVVLNLAAVLGLWRFLTGRQRVTW